MKYEAVFILALVIIFAAGCQETTPVCPVLTGTPESIIESPEELPTPTSVVGQLKVSVGKTELMVDKIVEGPLCNDDWSGTVYVACDVQVYPWVEAPTFLENCQLNIEPHTVVFVAYHNNTAYYNGCSCHTGITPEP